MFLNKNREFVEVSGLVHAARILPARVRESSQSGAMTTDRCSGGDRSAAHSTQCLRPTALLAEDVKPALRPDPEKRLALDIRVVNGLDSSSLGCSRN